MLNEWYILSEFHGWEEACTKGSMGDILGKLGENELDKIRVDVKNLAIKL